MPSVILEDPLFIERRNAIKKETGRFCLAKEVEKQNFLMVIYFAFRSIRVASFFKLLRLSSSVQIVPMIASNCTASVRTFARGYASINAFS